MGNKKNSKRVKKRYRKRYIRNLLEILRQRRAAQNKNGVAEPQQQLDPLEKIFLFQSSNVETQKKQKVEIKREYPNELESDRDKLDLELDVDVVPKTREQEFQNLVIDKVISEESTSGCKRSTRIKMKEVMNQEKILQAIQAENQRKENDQEEVEDQSDVESIEEESQEDEAIEEDQHKVNSAEPADQLNMIFLPENDQQNQELDIKTEDQNGQQFEELEHDESHKPKLGQSHKPNSIRINNGMEKENEIHNNQNKDLQHEDLLIERESVPNVEIAEVKRKRGRPRKSLDATTPVVKEKRKRGRPPKPRNDNNELTTGKRKRGRPRKQVVNENQIVDIPVAPLQEENDEEESEEEYTVLISEEVMEDPIHLEIQGVINFLV